MFAASCTPCTYHALLLLLLPGKVARSHLWHPGGWVSGTSKGGAKGMQWDGTKGVVLQVKEPTPSPEGSQCDVQGPLQGMPARLLTPCRLLPCMSSSDKGRSMTQPPPGRDSTPIPIECCWTRRCSLGCSNWPRHSTPHVPHYTQLITSCGHEDCFFNMSAWLVHTRPECQQAPRRQ
jgi:hypothetical protein